MTFVAVIGHVEWVEFLNVERIPAPGEIVDARRAAPCAGGSAVIAASVLAQAGAEVLFIGALGDDPEADSSLSQMHARGIQVAAVRRPGPTRRAVVLADGDGERTILTAGERHAPGVADRLPWDRLAGAAAVYVTAGDHGVFERARAAARVVTTPRAGARGDAAPDHSASTRLDALVFSAHDEVEAALARTLEPSTDLMVATEGKHGGRWWGTEVGSWEPAPLPGPLADTYGCGDTFAAGFTLGLAEGMTIPQAVRLGAEWAARLATRRSAP